MTSYDLSRSFWNFAFEHPSKMKPIHCSIFFFAIEHCNRLGWKNEFGLPTSMVIEAIGVKSYSVYKKAFDDLVNFGFFKVIQYSKNQYSSNIIALQESSKANTKALGKALSKHASKQRQSTIESTVSIDKQYINNTNQRTHTTKCVGASEFLIDFDKLGEYFNSQLSPPLPKVLLPITEKRIAAVEAMVKEYGKDKVLEMLTIASKSKFLLGHGSSGWKARFDWLFMPENFVNVLEGSYLGTEKKDAVSKADKAYIDRLKTNEEHQKYLDEIARTCTLPPKGLSINRINTK